MFIKVDDRGGLVSLGGGDLRLTLAKAITNKIDWLGLTQSEAAKILKSSQSDVSRIMNGNMHEVSLMRLMRYAYALEIDLELKIDDHVEEGMPKRSTLDRLRPAA